MLTKKKNHVTKVKEFENICKKERCTLKGEISRPKTEDVVTHGQDSAEDSTQHIFVKALLGRRLFTKN